MPDVAKVVDFGLVKHFDTSTAETSVLVTAAHTLIGTPLYMAPEAITGDAAVDARSDLYSLGAVGYFLLTGTPLFSARTIVEMCSHHLHTPPEPPSARRGKACPPALERVILQCLAKSPGDRPANARALQAALKACAGDSSWSDDEAARWWAAFRLSRPTPTRAPRDLHLTAVVDLANRVNQFR
jgi:serine/threonine-protein kinase